MLTYEYLMVSASGKNLTVIADSIVQAKEMATNEEDTYWPIIRSEIVAGVRVRADVLH